MSPDIIINSLEAMLPQNEGFMDKMKHYRLQELDRSDFEIVDGQPDIRGWDVKNDAGHKIGEVEDLIIDARQKKVRYMVVDLDDNELKVDHRKVLIPIGLAELHREDDDVIVPGVAAEQLMRLPKYDRESLTPEVERTICSAFGRNTSPSADGEGDSAFYSHDYYNDDNLYRQRPGRSQKESDYEKGLRLWESRSKGGIIGDSGIRSSDAGRSDRDYGVTEKEDARRMEMVRNRRTNYQQRRYGSGDSRSSEREPRHDSVEDRIRREGLRDAGDF